LYFSAQGRAVAADGNAQSRARTRTWTWPVGGARPAWDLARPGSEFALATQLRRWAAQEIAAGRLLPWLAVAYGFGIVIYFTAEHEPAWWAAAGLAAGCVAAAVALRAHPTGFVAALSIAAIASGFAGATARTALIAHPVLRFAASGVTVAGFVELREESQHTDRMVIRVVRIEGSRIDDRPQRVRLSVKRGMAPPPGAFVEVKALLDPPLQPLAPGSYDFARDLYFQGIGASGFVRGAIKVISPPSTAGVWAQADAAVQRLRDLIDARVRAVLPGDVGAIAAMLLNGRRDVISENLFNAMFISGIGHVLSISGYHMAVVAGVMFFFFRALLALIPGLADRMPIKKWAAAAALGATTFYLVLSGAAVATQRSYFMIAIVLIGVMADRPALTIRTLTAAAMLVLLFAPEAVVHPSFQMSFAATLALVTAYERGVPRVKSGTDTTLHARAALWGVNEILSLTVASLVAGFATTPYAAYHFHRLAPYGVIANLLAMPVVSAWVMPMGLLGLFAIPFGFDAEFWRQMGYGIEWMDAVALWVAGLPGAVGHVTSFGTGALLLETAGLLTIGLLKTPLRLSGIGLAVLGVLWAAATPRPDVLVAADGRTFAVRGADGRLAFHHSGGDTFAIKEWLAADADARDYRDRKVGDGIACDASGCIGKLRDGGLVAYDETPDAFEEDCRRAVLIVTGRDPPPDCAAPVIGRPLWRRRGALALRRTASGFVMESARSQNFDRPWSPAPPPRRRSDGASDANSDVTSPASPRAAPRDATPTPEAVEADE
jgi:competence protein ComEC